MHYVQCYGSKGLTLTERLSSLHNADELLPGLYSKAAHG